MNGRAYKVRCAEQYLHRSQRHQALNQKLAREIGFPPIGKQDGKLDCGEAPHLTQPSHSNDINLHAFTQSAKEAPQAGSTTPNVRFNLSEDSVEFMGLGAGKGYSGVVMGINFGNG